MMRLKKTSEKRRRPAAESCTHACSDAAGRPSAATGGRVDRKKRHVTVDETLDQLAEASQSVIKEREKGE